MGAVSTFSVPRRGFAYVVLGLGLLGCSIPLGHLAWVGNPWIHTLLETVSTLLALILGGVALVRGDTRKSLSYLVLGAAFLGAGCPPQTHWPRHSTRQT